MKRVYKILASMLIIILITTGTIVSAESRATIDIVIDGESVLFNESLGYPLLETPVPGT